MRLNFALLAWASSKFGIFGNEKWNATAGFLINDTTRFWHTAVKLLDPLPLFIWYDFRVRRLIPARISFHPRRDSNRWLWGNSADAAKKQTPTQFQFVGSNDASCGVEAVWTVLCEDLGRNPVTSQDETRGCPVNKRQSKFRCLGLKILANQHQAHSSLSGIRMWARKSADGHPFHNHDPPF